jgi:hypothetical protein
MKIKTKFTGILILSLASLWIQGCFQDYTLEERNVVSGSLLASSEQREVSFNFDNITSFPVVSSRLASWFTTGRSIEITQFDKLPILNIPGSHFELWASGSQNVSFGKFRVSQGDLVSFVDGVTGPSKCSLATSKICTFTMTDPSTPLFTDLDRVEISIEPPFDGDLLQTGSRILSGSIINENAGTVDPLIFPVSFSQNAITASASLTLLADQAAKGLVTLNLTGFPFLDNQFVYQFWSADAVNGFVSCGAFNVQDGVIVNPTTLVARGSSLFSCGVDLGTRTEMVLSLEPIFQGNSSGIFDFQPFSATYTPFDNQVSVKPTINNVRASIAGGARDRSLSDVKGKFSVLTGVIGDSHVVFRSLDFKPDFSAITVDRGSSVGGIQVSLVPKVKGEAIFHFFERDFPTPITGVKVSPSFTFFPLAMNDSGVSGDKIAGDGVWTIISKSAPSGSITYTFSVNAKTNFNDPHAEKLATSRSQPTLVVK